jgi:dTDP-4-dehydrorhamnose reductase
MGEGDWSARPAVWAGVECSRLRVRRRVVDQLELTGHAGQAGQMELLADLGAAAVRYPVLWERVAPHGLRQADWSWTDERLGMLRSFGIRPIAGLLHHGGGPRGMSILHPGFPAAFGRFAGAVARRYPWIDAYLPINEPLTTARFSGLYGRWQPHGRSAAVFAQLILAQCLAIRAAADAIRAVQPGASLIVNEDVGRTFSTDLLAGQAAFVNERRWLTWDLLLGRVDRQHPMFTHLATGPERARELADLVDRPCPPDLLGIDHYVTSDRYLDDRVGRAPELARVQPDGDRYVDIDAVRIPGLPVAGIRAAIADTWQRYGQPMILAEVSLAGGAMDQVAWWWEAWEAASTARTAGIPIEAVTAWAVFGATDWHSTLTTADGRYEPGCFDVRMSPPTLRPVGRAVQAAATGRGSTGPRLAGWWQTDDRFIRLGAA